MMDRASTAFRGFLLLVTISLLTSAPASAQEVDHAKILSSLVDPVKIDGLAGDRATNPRLRKITYWVESARLAGKDPETVILEAQKLARYAGTPRADAERAALLRNRLILERLGCLSDYNMNLLRRGLAPTVTQGPYAGDLIHVDHIIPRAIAPELDLRLYNLEFMPSKLNLGKGAKIGLRQKQLASSWFALGLLSRTGFDAVTAAATANDPPQPAALAR